MAANTSKRNKRKYVNVKIDDESSNNLCENEKSDSEDDLLQSIDKEDDTTDEEADEVPADLENGDTDPLLEEFDDVGSGSEEEDDKEDEDSEDNEDDDNSEDDNISEDESVEGEASDDNDEIEGSDSEEDDGEEEVEWESSSDEADDSEVEEKPAPKKISINNKNKTKQTTAQTLNKNNQIILKPSKIDLKKTSNTAPKQEVNQKARNKNRKGKGKYCQQAVEETTALTSESGEKPKENEYEDGDTSDEEDIRNTVGNVPMNWYNEYPHCGYDWDAKPILKPKGGDSLDNFLRRMEDPNFFRTVKDPQTGQEVVLSDQDIELVKRLQMGQYPDANFEDCPPWVEYFTSQVLDQPVRKFPERKSSFLPSRSEALQVSKYVHAMKMGWLKTMKEQEEERQKKKVKKFYALWGTDDTAAEAMRRITSHIPAPKRYLPGHAESYNPPPEYLFDNKERKQWEKQADEPWKRKLPYIPQKYSSLRTVPAYRNYIRERFIRCLDLYLCPRAIKQKLQIQPEDLIPKLPSAKDLQPFPTTNSVVYEGHTNMVRTITIEPKGQYLISGSDDQTIRVWEVVTGRCLRIVPVGGIARCVEWCPNQALALVAVAADRKIMLINPKVGDTLVVAKTDALMKEEPAAVGAVPDRILTSLQWGTPEPKEMADGIRIVINHFKDVRQVTWHGRGDYFAAVLPEGANRSVIVHQLSRRKSQFPFNKSKGLVQCVMFHPVRPVLFVATQRNIRVYDLMKQEMIKKLVTYSQWISSMAIHPGNQVVILYSSNRDLWKMVFVCDHLEGGDNIIVGTYDRKLLWFDLDLSNEPYKALRLHLTAIRGVAFHKRYPLFASASDDRSVIISHGMVYNDLLENPLLVPVKRLLYHEERQDYGVFDVKFHPTQPWAFSCGADATVRLYS